MSRRSTKQRRAALWRREWCALVREWREEWGDEMAGHMASYSEQLARGPWAFGLGLKTPQALSGRARRIVEMTACVRSEVEW